MQLFDFFTRICNKLENNRESGIPYIFKEKTIEKISLLQRVNCKNTMGGMYN